MAFKLCQGLAEARGVGDEELYAFLDLVGLATVADLVPLKGENRILARYGLKALGRTKNPGLDALMSVAGISREGISAGAGPPPFPQADTSRSSPSTQRAGR